MYIHKTTFRPSPATKEKNRVNGKKFGFQKGHETNVGRKGQYATNWKGENAGYQAIHQWLNANYGKPTECEHEGKHKGKLCYAKIKGKRHAHNRKHYIQLCHRHHAIYDGFVDNFQSPVEKQAVAGITR